MRNPCSNILFIKQCDRNEGGGGGGKGVLG